MINAKCSLSFSVPVKKSQTHSDIICRRLLLSERRPREHYSQNCQISSTNYEGFFSFKISLIQSADRRNLFNIVKIRRYILGKSWTGLYQIFIDVGGKKLPHDIWNKFGKSGHFGKVEKWLLSFSVRPSVSRRNASIEVDLKCNIV